MNKVKTITQFNVEYYFLGREFRVENATFPECKTVGDVREWLNKTLNFIDIGNRIVNKNSLQYIEVEIAGVVEDSK
tara:strand:- start:412 stop:639 length:228 start_codon:yes stop_codon:yes gene_type:complete